MRSILFCLLFLGAVEFAAPQAPAQAPPRPTGTASPALAWPLRTEGNQIVDRHRHPVRLMALNWYGLESRRFAPEGLDRQPIQAILGRVRAMGFNAIRIPFCTEALNTDSLTGQFAANQELSFRHPYAVMVAIVLAAKRAGIGVIFDHHRLAAGDSGAEPSGLWFSSRYPIERVTDDWKRLADAFKGEPAVIGFDLHNEPHGERVTWGPTTGSNPVFDWHAAAQGMGAVVATANPNVLIIVSGISHHRGERYGNGGNLMGVRERQVNIPGRVVYSPHDYPPSVIDHEWFTLRAFPTNIPSILRRFWGFVYEERIGPIFLGEFGSRLSDDVPRGRGDRPWFDALMGLMNGDFLGNGSRSLRVGEAGMSWAWWALNPVSRDTGGVLNSDWTTSNTSQLEALQPVMTLQGTLPAVPALRVQRPLARLPSCLARVDLPSAWGVGAIVRVTVSPVGGALDEWQVGFRLTDGIRITDGPWDGVLAEGSSRTGAVLVDHGARRGAVAAGGTASFQFKIEGGATAPSGVTLNAVPCGALLAVE